MSYDGAGSSSRIYMLMHRLNQRPIPLMRCIASVCTSGCTCLFVSREWRATLYILVLNTRRPLVHESISMTVRFESVDEGLISISTSENMVKPLRPQLQTFWTKI
jgi:hypothetical protein